MYIIVFSVLFACLIYVGLCILSNMVCQFNVPARFRVDNDTWPPDQPKNFIPLILIHYEGHRYLQQAMAIITNR